MARMEAKLSLADVAGGRISRTAIHLIEVGKMRPSLETLQLIAEKTNKPVSFFMAAEPPEFQSMQTSDLERAASQNDFLRVIELGERLLQERHDEPEEALIRYNLGRAHVQGSHGHPALEYLERALEVFTRLGDQLGQVECLDQIACAYFRLDDPRQQPTADEALRKCRELRPIPKYLESRILGNLALMHANARRWQQAIYFYEECLKAGSDVRNLRHRALVYDGLSLAYERLGNLAGATAYAHKAITLYSLESDIAAIALAENNLADILMKSGHLVEAERHVMNGLRLCEENDLQHSALVFGLLTLGEIHQLRRDADAATILTRAIRAAETQGQKVAVACAHQLLGRIAAGDHRPAAAIEEFELAASLLEELNMPERLRDCLLEYAACVESTGAAATHLWKRAAFAGAGSSMPGMRSERLAESQSAG
jgi:tetratricopeptide (TPR) repeat protein